MWSRATEMDDNIARHPDSMHHHQDLQRANTMTNRQLTLREPLDNKHRITNGLHWSSSDRQKQQQLVEQESHRTTRATW